MKINFRLIQLLLIFFINNLIGQTTTQSSKFAFNNVKTPGVSDFIKYGNLSSNNYVGELKVNIPILTQTVQSQNDLNLSLSYTGSGFKPGKRNGLVGQNWYLNVGGVITRKINGMPDDKKGQPNINGAESPTNGFIVGVLTTKQNFPSSLHTSSNVYSFNNSTSYTSLNFDRYLYGLSAENNSLSQSNPSNYEGEPDIFTFNFNGISGSFFMGNDGDIKVVTESPNSLKIDLSEFAFQDANNTSYGTKPKTPSRIKIIDDRGNIYLFGGETKNLEYTLNLIGCSSQSNTSNNLSNKTSDKNPTITSWMLYEIQYYCGNVVKFNYKNDSSLMLNFANENQTYHEWNSAGINSPLRDFLQLNEYFSTDASALSNMGSYTGTGGSSGLSGFAGLKLTLNKIAILENISTDAFQINFLYSKQANKFNTRTTGLSYYDNNLSKFNDFIDIKLDNIFLVDKYNNNTIKSFNFSYDYLGGSHNSRMFLRSITEIGKPPHVFQYYNETDLLPSPITFGIDHWGFWNGRNETSNRLIPLHSVQSNGDVVYSSLDNGKTKDPNFNFALKGQLKKIIYPTKGSTTFEYDTHQYSKRLEIRSSNDFKPILYNVAGICGGVRIKKVYDFDGQNDTINKKEYTHSEGILLKWPRYSMYFTCDASYCMDTYYFYRSNPIGRNLAEDIVLTYGLVNERYFKQSNIGPDLGELEGNNDSDSDSNNGSILTKYRDFLSNPDLDSPSFNNSGFYPNPYPSGLAKNIIGYYLDDRSIERGKPEWIKTYDSIGKMLMQEKFYYNENPNRFNQYSTSIHLTGPYHQANKVYFYNDYLTRKETLKYDNPNIFTTSNALITNEDYTYINNLPKSTALTNSNDDVLSTIYHYPFESSMSSEPFRTGLLEKNIVGIHLKTENFKNSLKVFEEKIVFNQGVDTYNILKPKYFYNRKTNDNVIEKKITIDKYDNRGNVVQFTKENGIVTSYLWGYFKKLLIAKIENATISQIAYSLGITEAVLLESSQNFITQIDNLRSNPSYANALISTYKYDSPLIGVSKITDPKGDFFTYHYDTMGRLIYVKDKDDNFLYENEYNYKP